MVHYRATVTYKNGTVIETKHPLKHIVRYISALKSSGKKPEYVTPVFPFLIGIAFEDINVSQCASLVKRILIEEKVI